MRPCLALISLFGLGLAACDGGGDVTPDGGGDVGARCPDSPPDQRLTGNPGYCLVDGAMFASRAEDPIENSLRDTADAAMLLHIWDWFNSNYRAVSRGQHVPPYTDEVSSGIAGFGRTVTDRFTVAESMAPSAIYGMAMVVPAADAPIGNTPDGDGLPMIVDAYTLNVTYSLRRGGQSLDGGSSLLAGPGLPYQGISHAPIIWVEQTDEPSSGDYEIWLEVWNDAGSASITLPFTIE